MDTKECLLVALPMICVTVIFCMVIIFGKGCG